MRKLMPVFVLLQTLFFLFPAFAMGETLDQRIEKFRQLQSTFRSRCPQGAQTPASAFQFSLNGKMRNCRDFQQAISAHGSQINEEVTALRASCDEETQESALASATLEAVRLQNERSRVTDAQCLGEFTCGVVSVVLPPVGILATGATFAGVRNSCVNSVVNNIPGCALQVLKGIFDNIVSNVSLIWNAGRLAARKVGELTGIVAAHEMTSSERLLAAQNANTGFVAQFRRDPFAAMQTLMRNFYHGMKNAAMNSYGCERWSGAPFTSTCRTPMTNWNEASCRQRTQMFCGIGGFAAGEIVTAFLTGGMIEVGRAALLGVRGVVQASRTSRAAAATFREAKLAAESVPRVAAVMRASSQVTRSAAALTVAAWESVARGASFVYSGVKQVPALGAYLRATEAAAVAGGNAASQGIRVLTAGTTSANAGLTLSEVALLRDPQRIELAQTLLSRSTALSSEQSAAIIRAHEVGAAEGRGYGTYTLADIRAKTQILRDAGFTSDEIRILMDRGVTGTLANSVPSSEDESLTQFFRTFPSQLDKSLPDVVGLGDIERSALAVQLAFPDSVMTMAQARALNAARDVGLSEGRAFGSYNSTDISEKTRILTEAGFTRVQAQTLLSRGVLYKLPPRPQVVDEILQWSPQRNPARSVNQQVWSASTSTQVVQWPIGSTPTLKTMVDVHLTKSGGQLLVAQIRNYGDPAFEIMRSRLQAAIASIDRERDMVSRAFIPEGTTGVTQTQWSIDLSRLNREQVDSIVSALDLSGTPARPAGTAVNISGSVVGPGVTASELPVARARVEELQRRFETFRSSPEVIRNGYGEEGQRLVEELKAAEVRELELRINSGILSTPAPRPVRHDSGV